METEALDSVDKGRWKVTEVMDLEDRGIERERGGKGPGAPGRARSVNHCCISGQAQEPCGHLGYPKSVIFIQ